MGLIIPPDDIEPGMSLTVHTSAPARGVARPAGDGALRFESMTMPCPVPLGTPLEVLEVSLPYVLCAVVQAGGGRQGPVTLDIRQVRLCRLTPAYVAAMEGFPTGAVSDESCSDDEEYDCDDE